MHLWLPLSCARCCGGGSRRKRRCFLYHLSLFSLSLPYLVDLTEPGGEAEERGHAVMALGRPLTWRTLSSYAGYWPVLGLTDLGVCVCLAFSIRSGLDAQRREREKRERDLGRKI